MNDLLNIINHNIIVIKLDNNYISINDKQKIKYSNTNLPKEFFNFKSNKEIYWNVEQFKSDSSTLKINVLDYTAKNVNSFYFQDFNEPIEQLIFDKLDWIKLEPLLSSHLFGKLKPILKNYENHIVEKYLNDETRNNYNKEPLIKPSKEIVNNSNFYKSQSFSAPNKEVFKEQKIVPENILKEFEIEFAETVFLDGKVKVTVLIHTRYHQVYIYNSFIKKEFDYIKKWFPKKFNKATFSLSLKAVLIGSDLEDIETSSKEIESIDQTFIDTFRIHAFSEYVAKSADSEKVYSVNDILTNNGNNSNLFSLEGLNEIELIKEFIRNSKVRNEKQLEFLASHSLVSNNQLRITIYEKTGFVFTYLNNSKVFFIWEILESNATYVWSFDTKQIDIKGAYDCIEKEISKIIKLGREPYFKTVNMSNNLFMFKRIYHTLQELEGSSGFDKWIKTINSIIGFKQ